MAIKGKGTINSQPDDNVSATAEPNNDRSPAISDNDEYFYDEYTLKRKRDIEDFLDSEVDYLTIKSLDYHISLELWEDDIKNFKQQFLQKQDHLIAEAKTVNHQYNEFFQGISKVDSSIEQVKLSENIEGVTPDPLLGTHIYYKADCASTSLKHYSTRFGNRIETVVQEMSSLKKSFDNKKEEMEAEAKQMKMHNQRFFKLIGNLNKEKLKIRRRS